MIQYKFKDGTTADFILKGDSLKVEWSPELTSQWVKQHIREYTDECIPEVYQKLANERGGRMVWMDSVTYESKVFNPE